jgi:hypothetical protein
LVKGDPLEHGRPQQLNSIASDAVASTTRDAVASTASGGIGF